MVEFGEQLRKAREAKGITQKTLAEQLYVTRQAVSKWECGERYPDLLTTKKISKILDVSLDDLLSENEMSNMVERNPLVEKGFGRITLVVIYTLFVAINLLSLYDVIWRINKVDPSVKVLFNKDSIRSYSFHLITCIAQIILFTFAIISIIRGKLTPKLTGLVTSIFFATICTSMIYMSTNIGINIAIIFVSIIGLISAFDHFNKHRKSNLCFIILTTSSLLVIAIIRGMVALRIANIYQLYFSCDIIPVMLLTVIYQAYVIKEKRKRII